MQTFSGPFVFIASLLFISRRYESYGSLVTCVEINGSLTFALLVCVGLENVTGT